MHSSIEKNVQNNLLAIYIVHWYRTSWKEWVNGFSHIVALPTSFVKDEVNKIIFHTDNFMYPTCLKLQGIIRVTRLRRHKFAQILSFLHVILFICHCHCIPNINAILVRKGNIKQHILTHRKYICMLYVFIYLAGFCYYAT